MKRQKRDHTERAFKKGFVSGTKGHSKDLCPYQELNKRETWLVGWREGWDAHKNGYL